MRTAANATASAPARARDSAGGDAHDDRRAPEVENAALTRRLTELRVALERLLADNAELRRELKLLGRENRRLRDQLPHERDDRR